MSDACDEDECCYPGQACFVCGHDAYGNGLDVPAAAQRLLDDLEAARERIAQLEAEPDADRTRNLEALADAVRSDPLTALMLRHYLAELTEMP